VLDVGLLTRGSPESLTGGHLYQRRMADAAPSHDASVTFVQTHTVRPSGIDRFDVVVVDSITAWRLAPRVLRRRAPPLVAMVHQPPGGIGGPWMRRAVQGALDRLVYSRCDAVVASSRALADELVSHVDPSRAHVIEPGCDLPTGVPDWTLRRGSKIAVLCVANWLPHKGVLELVEAVRMLPTGDVTLHLVGRDDVDRRYRRRVHRCIAASKDIVVHGSVDRATVAGLYAGADVFAMPSYVETYGIAAAEALLTALPVVGWRAGNLPNLVTDDVEGCLVTPGDVAALSGAISRLATDDEWRARLAAAAQTRGMRLPTWADTARSFFAVLRGSPAGAVEPADHRAVGLDVDAADARVLDEEPPRDERRDTERPGEGRLDRADVTHDHDDGRTRRV
jgi:glycosyltransferase involved in cell wall biosynthesis